MKKRERNKILNSWKNKKTKKFDAEKMKISASQMDDETKLRLFDSRLPFPEMFLTDEIRKMLGRFGFYFVREFEGIRWCVSEEVWSNLTTKPIIMSKEELNDPLADHNYDKTFEDVWKKNNEEAFLKITKPLVSR